MNLWTDGAHAQTYLERRDALPHRHEGYAALLEFLPADPARVLDLGTGDGQIAALVLAAYPAVEVVACDFSAEMLGRARVRFAGLAGVTVVEHDLDEPLPAAWGTFDAVVSGFVIHHVTDDRKRALYGEIFERLAPGGALCNLEHVASPAPELHAAFLGAIGRAVSDDDPSNKLAPVEAQLRWLRDCGFVQVDCHWKWRELALLAAIKPDA